MQKFLFECFSFHVFIYSSFFFVILLADWESNRGGYADSLDTGSKQRLLL